MVEIKQNGMVWRGALSKVINFNIPLKQVLLAHRTTLNTTKIRIM